MLKRMFKTGRIGLVGLVLIFLLICGVCAIKDIESDNCININSESINKMASMLLQNI